VLNGTIKAEDLSAELAWIGGGDVTVPNNKNLIFADDETNPATADAAWFTEATTGESDNIEVRMILGFEEDDSEKFSIYRYSDSVGTIKTKEHEFTAAGNAYHKNNLTVGGYVSAGTWIDATGTVNPASPPPNGTIVGNISCTAALGCINSTEIEDGAILNSDISNTAAIAPAKIAGTALVQTSLFTGGDVTGSYAAGLTIGANKVTSAMIVDGTVGNGDLSSTAVTTDKIVDGSILGSDLANNTLTALQINTGAVTSDEILDATITSADLANDSVGSAQIQNGAVGTSEILDGQVMAADIGTGQIDGSKIANTSWGSTGVATKFSRDDHNHDATYLNVNGGTLGGDLTLSRSTADTTLTIKNTGATYKSILSMQATNSSASFQLSPNSTNVNLVGANLVLDANKSVTAYGLTLTGTTGALACTDCVDSTDIQNGTITSADIVGTGLAATSITGEALTKLTSFSGEVTGTWNSLIVANNVIDVDNLKTDSVDATKIVNGTILTDDIQNRTIQAVDISNDAITANEIAAGAVTSSELAVNAVYTNALQNASVTASKLATDAVSSSNIVDNAITSADIQDYTITATDLSNNFWSTLDTNYVVKDGRQILFEDSDDVDRAAYFKEFSGAGALDLGLVLGYNNSDLADQTFSIYSSDAANNKVLRHQFRADGSSELRGDTFVGDKTAGAELSAGELARVATYSTGRSDLIVSGAIIHPKDSSAGGGTALAVADVFEIRSDAITSAPTHGYLAADAASLVLAAGNRGAGTLILNRKDNVTAGEVQTGGDLRVGGNLICGSGLGDCVSGSTISNGTVTTDDILNGTVGTVDLAANSVTSAILATDAVYTNAIQNNAVTSAKILDRTIVAADIGNDQLTSNEIGAGAITSSELAANAVYTNALQDASVTNPKLAANAVNSGNIVDGSIVSADIQDGAIQNADLQAGSATTGLTLDKFKDSDKPTAPGGTLAVWKVGAGQGTGNALFFEDDTDGAHQDATDGYLREISDGAVTDVNVRLVLPDGSGTEQFSIGVNTTEAQYKHKLDSQGNAEHTGALTVGGAVNVAGQVNANGNIITMNGNKYALYASGTTLNVNYNGTSAPYATTYIGGAVSMGGLTATSLSCPNCVGSATIADGTVGTADLVDGGVGAVDLAANAVDTTKILDGTIIAGDLAANSIDNSKIIDGQVYSAEIQDGTIANIDISASAAIARTKIANGALTGATVFQGSIGSSSYDLTNDRLTLNLGNDSVSSAHIVNGSVANVDLAADAITTDKILNGTIQPADLAFTVVGAGTDVAVAHNRKLSFETSDTLGANENGESVYFQEITGGADNDAELALFFANNNGATPVERFAVYKSDGVTNTVQHQFFVDGRAVHKGDITGSNIYAANAAGNFVQAYLFKDADAPASYYVDPSSGSAVNTIKAYQFQDYADATYYVDPNGLSVLGSVQIQSGGKYRDADDAAGTTYYLDPSLVSQVNDMRARIFYDLDNTAYYANPAGTSRLSVTQTDQSYTYGWFRNYNAGTGLYNEATARHFYSQDANYWRMGSNYGMIMYDGANSALRGYLYHDGTNIGLLPPDGSWQVRAWNAGVELYDTTYMASAQANIYYDRDNTGYYVDPASTSRMYHGRFDYVTTGEWGSYNQFYSWTNLNGYVGLYSTYANGSYFYVNNSSYGAWRIAGNRNGWYGLEFDTAGGQTALMWGHTTQGWGAQQTGAYNASQGVWLWRFDHKTLNASGFNDFEGGNVDPSGTSSLTDVNASCVARGGSGVNTGCPNGWLGAGDFCISGYTTSNNNVWREAVKYCAQVNAHLCRYSEYVAAKQVGQIGDDSWYWTADQVTSGNGGSYLYPLLFRSGTFSPSANSPDFTYVDTWEWTGRPWRCCVSK